jgi:hypothetical protein
MQDKKANQGGQKATPARKAMGPRRFVSYNMFLIHSGSTSSGDLPEWSKGID